MLADRMLEALRTGRRDGPAIAAWSVFASESRRMALGIKDREAGNAHAPLSLSESCGARYLLVWDDGQISRGYLERRQLEEDPRGAVDQARAAAYDDPDAAQVLGPAEMPQVELFDASTAELAAGDTSLIERRLAEIRPRVAKDAVSTWSGSFSASAASSRLVTSAGLDARGEGTSVAWHVTLNGEIGDGFAARRPETGLEFGRRLDRLEAIAVALREPDAQLAPGIHPVILHPRVVREYVLDTLLRNLDGATVDHGEGHFGRELFGDDRPVLREDLRLCLDPLRPFRSGSYRFTSEGLPAARCSFVERGRLIQPVLDLKYARRLGLEPTPQPYSSDALDFSGGARIEVDRAMDQADGGALVLSVLGVHTQDSASGDFSLAAPQALRLRHGGYAGRLRATISGNLFEVLGDPALRFVDFEGEHTPGLLFPCRLDPR